MINTIFFVALLMLFAVLIIISLVREKVISVLWVLEQFLIGRLLIV